MDAVIVGRIEANGRRLAVVALDDYSSEGRRFQVRDLTHGETGRPGTVDGVGQVLGNPMVSLEAAMRSAYQTLFGLLLIEPEPMRPASAAEVAADEYLSGNERALGMGPDEM